MEKGIKLLVLNHKCNFKKEEYKSYCTSLEKMMQEVSSENKIILCPSTCYLCSYTPFNVILGSQNVSVEEIGNHTGEVSASQLQSIGIKYTLIGHQEQRKLYSEKNSTINKKIKHLLNNNIIPILCVGEIEKESIQNTISKIKIDIEEAVMSIPKEAQEKIIIAYEPAWAIGGNIKEDIEEIKVILKEIKNMFPENKLIYGGGINTENIKILKNISIIDGFLVGSLSLDLIEINKLIHELDSEFL